MPAPLICIFLYVMVYTVGYGRTLWRAGDKFAGIVVFLLAAMIPAVLVRLVFFS